MEKLKLTSRPKRNYQFLQFILDIFALFMLYLIVRGIVEDIYAVFERNQNVFRANEELHGNPYPLIVWAVVALLVYIAGIVLPFVYKNRTKYTQKQYDIWVYGVLLTRVLVYVLILFVTAIHLDVILRKPDSIFNLQVLYEVVGCAVLIAGIVRFTQIRIRAAEPKTEKEKPREIVEG